MNTRSSRPVLLAVAACCRHGLCDRPTVHTSDDARAAGLSRSAAGRVDRRTPKDTPRAVNGGRCSTSGGLDALEDDVSISNQNVLAAEAQYRAARAAVRVSEQASFQR